MSDEAVVLHSALENMAACARLAVQHRTAAEHALHEGVRAGLAAGESSTALMRAAGFTNYNTWKKVVDRATQVQ